MLDMIRENYSIAAAIVSVIMLTTQIYFYLELPINAVTNATSKFPTYYISTNHLPFYRL